MRIDVALFIASMIGACTLSGFAYLEKYYLTLDVPIERIGLSTQEVLAYGAARLGLYLGALFISMAVVGTVTLFMLFFEKPTDSTARPSKLPTWISRVWNWLVENSNSVIFVLLLCLIALLLVIAWYLLVRLPLDEGRRAALSQASECVERQVVYTNLDRYEGCVVAESDDMLYLLKRKECTKLGVTFSTLELPKQGLKSITTAPVFYPYIRPESPVCPNG